MPRRQLQLLREGALAALLYTVAALVYLRPIWRVYPDHIAPNADDPLFNLYVLKWVLHQAHLGFPDLWNPNVFYPAKGALTFSDHFLGPALAISFIPNPIAGYNLLFFLSFVLSGLATWWVLAASGLPPAAALLGGAMYAFSPYRMSQANHLAILLAQWVPLTLWSFDRLLVRRTAGWAALFLLFYALNLTSGCYLAYMIHFPLLVLLASRGAALGRELLRPASLKVLAPVALLAIAGAVALFLPYIRLSKSGVARDAREVSGNAAALASYLSPAPESLYTSFDARSLWDRAHLPRWQQPFARSENSLFAGFLPTLLAILGFAAFWRQYRRPRPPLEPPLGVGRRLALGGLLAVALLAYGLGDVYTLKLDVDTALSSWLPAVSGPLWTGLGVAFLGSLGLWLFLRRRWCGGGLLDWGGMDPWERGLVLSGALSFLLAHSVVYLLLMRVVPGMNGMRVPARFVAFLGLTLVWFAAHGVTVVLSRMPRPAWRRLALAGLALVLFVELLPRPFHWVELLREEDFPDVYSWLAGRRDVKALLEIPMQAYAREVPYMYYSTRHWKPIANGYSGFLPPSYDRLAAAVGRNLPDAEAIDLVEQMGITHLVVHPFELGGEWRKAKDPLGLLRRWEGEMGRRIELVHDADPDRVYRIVPRAPAPAPIGISGLRVGELVPEAGVEPARPCERWILSPLRLPFRHSGSGRRGES